MAEEIDGHSADFVLWRTGSAEQRAQLITSPKDQCPDAQLLFPTTGFVGLYYGDSRLPYTNWRLHQGIDIFTDQPIGQVPVYASADGYITRETSWTSALIQRVPDQGIWLYYTHMADEEGNDFISTEFPRGTYAKFVSRGTLLGYIGNYDGNRPSRIWPHLHFSIVKTNYDGSYLPENDFNNTADPSPYLGLNLHYQTAQRAPARCPQPPSSQ